MSCASSAPLCAISITLISITQLSSVCVSFAQVSSEASSTQAAQGLFEVWQTPEAVTQGCDRALERAERARAQIKAMTQPTLSELLMSYQALTLALDTPMGLSSLLTNTHPDKSTRDAAERCEQRLSKFASAIGLDAELYQRFSAISSDAIESAAPHARRLYLVTMRDFKRSGVHLDQAN